MTQANDSSKAPLISVCIPTYNRPEMLRAALESCFAQTYPEIEVVIGDDSKNDLSEAVAAEFTGRFPGRVNYRHNVPSLGQNLNVDDIFKAAKGERIVLLHDDDLLLPNAIEQLASCWDQDPLLDGAFGKQHMMTHDGTTLEKESEELNANFYRVASAAGRQPVPSIPGILRMFPNDGYMVSAALAKKIGYRPYAEVGDACDSDFGIRFCLAAKAIWFLDEYTVKYRVTDESVSKGAFPVPYTYLVLSQAKVPAEAMPALKSELRSLAPSATSGFARFRQAAPADESAGRDDVFELHVKEQVPSESSFSFVSHRAGVRRRHAWPMTFDGVAFSLRCTVTNFT